VNVHGLACFIKAVPGGVAQHWDLGSSIIREALEMSGLS